MGCVRPNGGAAAERGRYRPDASPRQVSPAVGGAPKELSHRLQGQPEILD